MIQFGAILVVGGAFGALWRQYIKRTIVAIPAPALHGPDTATEGNLPSIKKVRTFDDIGEITHYQKVAWYTFAIATAGSWFYPPVRILSLPLLGYNTYNFSQVIQHSSKKSRKSPATIFETVGVTGSILTGSVAMASALLVLSFGTRKLLLQIGNITNNIGFGKPFDPLRARVWVLRDGAEVDLEVSDLQENDVVIFRPGEIVVIEGRVMEGSGSVNQFSLRKMMKTIPKQSGDRIYPSTRVESGVLRVKPYLK